MIDDISQIAGGRMICVENMFPFQGYAMPLIDPIEMRALCQEANVPLINFAIGISAWADDNLVSCVRVLSERIFRSVIYDLAVMPEFQNLGIRKGLVRRCREYFPDSEWLVETKKAAGFYKKIGFRPNEDIF